MAEFASVQVFLSAFVVQLGAHIIPRLFSSPCTDIMDTYITPSSDRRLGINPGMPNHECLSCGAVFSSRKKLSSHKPHCKATVSLTLQVFEQGRPEKRPRHVSPVLSDAGNAPEEDIIPTDPSELWYQSDEHDVGVIIPLSQLNMDSASGRNGWCFPPP